MVYGVYGVYSPSEFQLAWRNEKASGSKLLLSAANFQSTVNETMTHSGQYIATKRNRKINKNFRNRRPSVERSCAEF